MTQVYPTHKHSPDGSSIALLWGCEDFGTSRDLLGDIVTDQQHVPISTPARDFYCILSFFSSCFLSDN